MNKSSGQSETIIILDFGSQYAQLIARRVREKKVYSVLARPDVTIEEIRDLNPKGLIFTGGPSSVYEENAPRFREELFDLDVPILGICYGMQIACQTLGAEIKPAGSREFGRANMQIIEPNALLKNVPTETSVWMSHGDQVKDIGGDFIPLAQTTHLPLRGGASQNP